MPSNSRLTAISVSPSRAGPSMWHNFTGQKDSEPFGPAPSPQSIRMCRWKINLWCILTPWSEEEIAGLLLWFRAVCRVGTIAVERNAWNNWR